LLHGPNGVGKSYLCGCFTDKLPEKRYKILSLTHSSLTGSDLVRTLCRQLGIEPQMRRSDNVDNIHTALSQLGSRWPLLVLEEEVLQLCSHPVIGWPDAPPGVFGLRFIQVAAI
jgi:hypothetical protein